MNSLPPACSFGYILFDLVLSMQAAQIRDKYKQILEEPEAQDSEDQWEIAYSQMAKQRKKRILTESSSHLNNENVDGHQGVLALKEKLAQCLSNCKQHCKEVDRLKKEQLLFQEERIEWQQQASSYVKLIDQAKTAAETQNQHIANLQKDLLMLTNQMQQIGMDRQLQQKQADYYKSELTHIKDDFQRKQKQLKTLAKDYKLLDKYKRQNEYLKNDVERLSQLIEESIKFGKVSSELMKKHFLGKPHRELEYWYPQHLVGEIEHFLKKNQVGYGNKEFTNNLVKFIERVNEKIREENKSKTIIHSHSRVKDSASLKKPSKIVLQNSSYKKHSYYISSMREQLPTKVNTSSFLRPQPALCPFSQSTPPYPKSLCWDLLTEFKSIVFQLLLQKEVKRKKIKKMIDSMSNSVLELFDNRSTVENLNHFASIRLPTEHTALLK